MSAWQPRQLLLAPIRAYQRWISPALPARCRFYPTCSEYAARAVVEHGALRGTWLAIRRVGRCHPWHPGGVDHVPPHRSKISSDEEKTNGAVRCENEPDIGTDHPAQRANDVRGTG